MQATGQQETVEQVTAWLYEVAKRKELGDQFKATHFRTDGHWLHYAVRLGSKDVSERAETLLDIEEEWDAHQPHSEWRLMLVPGS